MLRKHLSFSSITKSDGRIGEERPLIFTEQDGGGYLLCTTQKLIISSRLREIIYKGNQFEDNFWKVSPIILQIRLIQVQIKKKKKKTCKLGFSGCFTKKWTSPYPQNCIIFELHCSFLHAFFLITPEILLLPFQQTELQSLLFCLFSTQILFLGHTNRSTPCIKKTLSQVCVSAFPVPTISGMSFLISFGNLDKLCQAHVKPKTLRRQFYQQETYFLMHAHQQRKINLYLILKLNSVSLQVINQIAGEYHATFVTAKTRMAKHCKNISFLLQVMRIHVE